MKTLSPAEFRALLDLLMCCDPWPATYPVANERLIKDLADRVALEYGYSDWLTAYHRHK